jgi:ion channel-forming bestrophin family protein
MIRYNPHSWKDHLFDVRGTLLPEIAARVAVCVLWAVAVVWWHKNLFEVAMPVTVHSLVGIALGLLLVFRTNASYDRYWEGRKLWGSIVNHSRNLVRLAQPYYRDDRESFLGLVHWTSVFSYSTMSTLKGLSVCGPAGEQLPQKERDALMAAHHPALFASQKLTAIIEHAYREGRLTDRIAMNLDAVVQGLVDSLGGCERIRKTPLPFAYIVHLRRAMVIYCFSLPFALVRDFGWTTVVDVALVAFIFFGIEEIGVEIEGPFGNGDSDLPLEEICANIHQNLYAMAELAAPPSDVDRLAL